MQNSSHNCKPGRESFNLFKKLINFIMSGMAGSHEEYFGLYNQGATCYLNTLLQTLYMTPEVKDTIDRFVGETYEPIDKDASICYQLKELFANLENDPAHTHGITRILGLSKKVFEQQDVEEYFRLLLNKIDEESNGSCNVLQIYQSKVINSLKCLECDTESQEECKLLDIPLSLSPPDYMKREYFNSVNESLEDFLKDTILSRDNLCYCERCEKKTETKTEYYFESLPQILALLLKRFEFDYSKMCFKKLHNSIKIPQKLTFRKKVRDTDKTEWCLLPDETGVTAMTKATQLKPGSSHGNDVSNASWNPQEDNDQEGTGVTAMTKATQLEPGSSHGNDESNASQNPQGDKDQESIPCIRTCSDGTEREYVANHSMAEHITGGTVKGTAVTAMTKATQLEPGSSHGNDESNASQNPQGDKDQEEYATYELFATCNHSGEYDSGHYVASIKTISSSKWYCFNDAFVHKEKDTSEESSGDGSNISSRSSSTAYMLMYRKEEVNSNQRVIADQGKPWNEQMEMRESSPFVNGATNHDLGQNNPTSDQNTKDLIENIDTKMNEEKGTVETLEENSSELMENGSLLHKTDGKEGVIAEQGIPWNEQMGMRESSSFVNGATNHDLGQSNPTSDQNTEDLIENIDTEMDEENGAVETMEEMSSELMENGSLLHKTDGKEGENADEDEQCKGQTRIRKFSPIRNGGNNHDFGQSNPPSDQNTEDSSEDIDIVMKEENGAGGAMEKMRCGLMANENLLHNTDGKGGMIAHQEKPWNEQARMSESSPFVNGATNHDLGQSNPTSDQNTEDLKQNIDTEMNEENGIVETMEEMSSELMENGCLIHKTDGKEGVIADQGIPWNEQMGMRESSPFVNGATNHDLGQSNPTSDQNTEDLTQNIDTEMDEEKGIVETIGEMSSELMENGSLIHKTDGKEGGNADADEKWNERKRMRKNSGTGNNVNNHGIRQGNPSSDPHTEHSPESSDAVMKGKQGTMKNIGMTCELKEKEKQIEETDWKED